MDDLSRLVKTKHRIPVGCMSGVASEEANGRIHLDRVMSAVNLRVQIIQYCDLVASFEEASS
jgi:hypothetical protein